MRTFTTREIYNLYFKETVKDIKTLTTLFNLAEKADKDKERINKSYPKRSMEGKRVFYYQSDIKEFLDYPKKCNARIMYAQQIIIDLEALYEEAGIKKYKSLLAKYLNVPNSIFTYLLFGIKIANQIIEAAEDLFSKMDIEDIRGLRHQMKLLSN